MRFVVAVVSLLAALPVTCALVAPSPRLSLSESAAASIAASQAQAKEWSDSLNLGEPEQAFFALFQGICDSVPMGLKGQPFVLKKKELEQAFSSSPFAGFYTYQDLAKSIQEDFLDAGRGTTDNRKGWKMTTVGSARGNSFEEARMTLEEVEEALQKGTVIFNSAGAHIPHLAGATLAAVEAACIPNALNMYVTAPNQRTSAPPHTDKQDVVVVQTCGKKHWRVYSPPDSSLKPDADMFARGKGSDNLPLFALADFGCELLLETTLEEGDVLFLPAGFPHTTDTARDGLEETSIHLTFGMDTRIWQLDYVSLRRLALLRAGVEDPKLGDLKDNEYVGTVNTLPETVKKDLMESLPVGFLNDGTDDSLVDQVALEAQRIAKEVDEATATAVDPDVWRETTKRLLQHGKEILDIHRDMYLAAIEEGRVREAEEAMTAHLDDGKRKVVMTPERMQRLSVFRVKGFMDQMEECTKSLNEWSCAGSKSGSGSGGASSALPDDWAFSLPLNVGDQVEADLGGAFFPAIVSKCIGNTYDITFFDGDQEPGMDRSRIKLLSPPAAEEDVDTSGMTPKQLKRWKKQQEKKQKLK